MGNLYLAMDNETGGLDDKTSLLSTYLEIIDDDFNIIDSLYLFVRPNDGLYVVEAGGLEVNKINIVEHDKIAISYSEAGQKLFKFLQKNSSDGKNRVIPLGKQITFDVDGVVRHLLGIKTWGKFVSHRMIDITGLAMSLQIKGRIPAGMSLSLTSLAEHFQITGIVGNPHEAKYDVEVTKAVYRKMLDML